MKLSNQTLEVLKNFSQINSGIFINKGNQLATTEKVSKTMVAYATVEETFPIDFGIYDLGKLLSIFSLTKTFPDIEFEQHHMIISNLGGRSKVKYRYCSEEMLTVPKPQKVVLPSEDIEFFLEEADYVWVSNTAKILETPHVSIRSDGSNMFLSTYDSRNDAIPDQSLDMNINPKGIKYNMVFEFGLWNKLIADSYTVTVSKEGIAHFKMQNRELEYFIATHESSEYDL